MLRKETVLGLWQKYSGTILSHPERLAFYENCKPLTRYDEHTVRTALNFCKKEGDFSIKRISQMATAVRRGTVGKILRRTEKDLLIEKIIYDRKRLVPVTSLQKRFKDKTSRSDIEVTYTEVERAWRIAALSLSEKSEELKAYLGPRSRENSIFEKIFSAKIFDE